MSFLVAMVIFHTLISTNVEGHFELFLNLNQKITLT